MMGQVWRGRALSCREMVQCIFRYLAGDCKDTSNHFYGKRGIARTRAAASLDSRLLRPRVKDENEQNEPTTAG
jgi:hypothetical protein